MEIDLYVVWNWSWVPPSIHCCQTWLQGLHLVVVDTSSHGYKWPRFLVFHIKIKWSTVIWIQINPTVFNCCCATHTKQSKRIVSFTLCILEYVLVVYDTQAKKQTLLRKCWEEGKFWHHCTAEKRALTADAFHLHHFIVFEKRMTNKKCTDKKFKCQEFCSNSHFCRFTGSDSVGWMYGVKISSKVFLSETLKKENVVKFTLEI